MYETNILVTGGCGFIGSNFINDHFLKNKNSFIVNVDALYYCADINNINKNVRESERYKFINGNICDYDLIFNTLTNNNIDTIIHFAAQSHVQDSFTDSSKYVQDNIVGTHTILEASRNYGKLKKIIHISTDEVYGESLFSDKLQKDEQSVLCPTNPYAATKASAELLASSYYHSFKLPVIITRGNNVYGPNQFPEKLIPRFIKLLRENKKVTIQGDGSNIRAFLHVLDVSSAIEHILYKGEIGEIYNIGSDEHEEYTVYEIAKILIKMIHSTKSQTSFNNDEDFANYIEYIEDRPFNDKRYFISNEKLKKLGWNIKIPFLIGIRDLINTS
jgi:UDP-glucose 4,6-dehydratase